MSWSNKFASFKLLYFFVRWLDWIAIDWCWLQLYIEDMELNVLSGPRKHNRKDGLTGFPYRSWKFILYRDLSMLFYFLAKKDKYTTYFQGQFFRLYIVLFRRWNSLFPNICHIGKKRSIRNLRKSSDLIQVL